MERIYFDNGSTSFPKAPGVSDAVKSLLDNGAFNINRGGYEEAYAISEQVLETREMLCRLFDFDKPRNVVFTPQHNVFLKLPYKGVSKRGRSCTLQLDGAQCRHKAPGADGEKGRCL